MKLIRLSVFSLLALPGLCQSLHREYKAGETVAYKMHGLNKSPARTVEYDAEAHGVVSKNSAGVFVERFEWTDLRFNGAPMELSPESRKFREDLSLAPGFALSIPDLSKVQPILIGPIADLLTFYADVQLAMRQGTLMKPGDHVYVKHGSPNSWADGSYTITGEDSIDFDITFQSINAADKTAILVVRHVPPTEPKIKLPVEWMRAKVSDTANNWVEVDKTGDSYSAQVGKETFEVQIVLEVDSGRIVSASMNNPVDAIQRTCTDAALSKCGASGSYQILRKISLEGMKH